MTALLILGCSQRKRGGTELTPALFLYDGPLARIARNWRLWKDGSHAARVDIYFVSAKYGLLHETSLIRTYDMRMTALHADAMRPSLSTTVGDRVLFGHYDQVAVSLGALYWRALDGALTGAHVPPLRVFGGGIGQRAKALKAWFGELDDAWEGGRPWAATPTATRPKPATIARRGDV